MRQVGAASRAKCHLLAGTTAMSPLAHDVHFILRRPPHPFTFCNGDSTLKRIQKGFNLLDLTIVVAIIGLLAVVALPVYHSYMKNAAYNDVVAGDGNHTQRVEVCYSMHNALDACDHGTDPVPDELTGGTGALKSVSVSNGVITMVPNAYKGIVEAETCVLEPSVEGQRLKWAYKADSACVTSNYVKN